MHVDALNTDELYVVLASAADAENFRPYLEAGATYTHLLLAARGTHRHLVIMAADYCALDRWRSTDPHGACMIAHAFSFRYLRSSPEIREAAMARDVRQIGSYVL